MKVTMFKNICNFIDEATVYTSKTCERERMLRKNYYDSQKVSKISKEATILLIKSKRDRK